MSQSLDVCLIQMNSVGDRDANLDAARSLMQTVVDQGSPDLIVLPEHFDWDGGTPAEKVAAADAMPGGDAYEMARSFARKHGIWIHAGSLLERVPGEARIFNTTVVFNRQGDEVARYRKIHLFDITAPDGADYRESETVMPGQDVVTYDLEGFTVGCAICYDLRFPSLFQALSKSGADIIALPAAFTLQTGKDHWEVLCRARAIENQAYLIACGQWGAFLDADGARRQTYGHSLVADPWGHVVARASDGVGIVRCHLMRSQLNRVRGLIPALKHRVDIAA